MRLRAIESQREWVARKKHSRLLVQGIRENIVPTNRKKRDRNRQKCPLGLWHVFIDDPLPPEHPEFNSFQDFLRPGEWDENKEEVLNYWMNKKTKPGDKKAIFLQKEGLLTEDEQKTLKTAQKGAKKD